jgi:hypothetical protein
VSRLGGTLTPSTAQDYCLAMPNFESQASLPQYFLLKVRASRGRCLRAATDSGVGAPSVDTPQLRAERRAATVRGAGLGHLRVQHEPRGLPRHEHAGELHA